MILKYVIITSLLLITFLGNNLIAQQTGSVFNKKNTNSFIAKSSCNAAFSYYESSSKLHFVDNSTGVDTFTNYMWSFPDSNAGTVDTYSYNDPSYEFSIPDTYYVTLIISGAGCSDTIISPVIYKGCRIGFSDSIGQNPNTVIFTDTSNYPSYSTNYKWYFGDNDTLIINNLPANGSTSHDYVWPQGYSVTFIAEENNGTCRDTISKVVTVPNICNADFSFYQYMGDVYFTSTSTGIDTNTVHDWSFGDNTWSQDRNPVKTYSAPGSYWVGLTTTDTACYDMTNQWVYFQVYTISGTVYDKDSALVSDAVIYLFETNQTNTILDTIDMKVIQPSDSGVYLFNNAHKSSNYILRVIADTNTYADHLSTYYGDAVSWSNASVLDLVTDTSGLDIYLAEKPSLMGGDCYISGILREGYGLMRGPTDPLDAIDIGIMNGSGDIVGSDVTDQNGIYSFDSLLPGSYSIIPEITGIPVDSSSLFNVIVQGSDTITVNINVDSNNIYSEPAVSIIIKDDISNNFLIYPMPVKKEFKINTHRSNLPYSLSIMDLNGRFLISHKNLNGENMVIKRNDLPTGLYIIEIMSHKERYLYKIAFE